MDVEAYASARPQFSQELVDECRDRGDYRPMLFEWYQHVGGMCAVFAHIQPESPGFRDIPTAHFAVLIGLLNRCYRLMLSNVALSSEVRFGETTKLIDRCIAESAIKLQWLCNDKGVDRFTRYLADGLKNDLLLKAEVKANVASRDGVWLEIERRMVRSIQRCLDASGLTDEEVAQAKALPNLYDMMVNLDLNPGMYMAVQRMGSHPVHGTWTELVLDYLEFEPDGAVHPRACNVEPHHNQFVLIIRLVLDAMDAFAGFMAVGDGVLQELHHYVELMRQDVTALDEADYGQDFEPVE